HKISLFGERSYYKLLNLLYAPKNEWRERIVEWEKVKNEIISSFFKDGSGLKDTSEFAEWLKKKKEEDRLRRVYTGKSLNKNQGDITMGWLRKTTYKNTITADKKAEKVEEVLKRQGM